MTLAGDVHHFLHPHWVPQQRFQRGQACPSEPSIESQPPCASPYLEDIPWTDVQDNYAQPDHRPTALQGSEKALGQPDSVRVLVLILGHLLRNLQPQTQPLLSFPEEPSHQHSSCPSPSLGSVLPARLRVLSGTSALRHPEPAPPRLCWEASCHPSLTAWAAGLPCSTVTFCPIVNRVRGLAGIRCIRCAWVCVAWITSLCGPARHPGEGCTAHQNPPAPAAGPSFSPGMG